MLYTFNYCRRAHEITNEDLSEVEIENIISSSISKQVNRVILNNLSKVLPHLLQVQVSNHVICEIYKKIH